MNQRERTILKVVGARPNFMKIAPLEQEFKKYGQIKQITVHTGQHYDEAMSDVFFRQLEIERPDWHLGIGSGSHGEMTGRIMIAFEKVCQEVRPDLVLVVGDVNSTLAAALVARKMFIPVAHVEAGLRSFDETMPEEHNRRLTDHLSNLLFAPEPAAVENLGREGIHSDRVHLVGDIMLETLQMFLGIITSRKRWQDFQLKQGSYAVVTIHRPSNVDEPQACNEVIEMLEELKMPALFPIHPRTMSRLDAFDLTDRIKSIPNVQLIPPESYIDFLSLTQGARLILSDSGSIQSEASFLNAPCLVCRENTERPIYLEHGTSVLVGRNKEKVRFLLRTMENGERKNSRDLVRQLGSGVASKTARIIVDYLDS